MNIGDTVKVFSSTSDYDGQTGRIVLIASAPGAPAPYVVQFGDAITEPFSEREIVCLKPIEPLWLSAPLETISAPHGASSRVQVYIGRTIAQRFIKGERRRVFAHADRVQTAWENKVRELTSPLKTAYANLNEDGSISIHGIQQSIPLVPCVQCGRMICRHRHGDAR